MDDGWLPGNDYHQESPDSMNCIQIIMPLSFKDLKGSLVYSTHIISSIFRAMGHHAHLLLLHTCEKKWKIASGSIDLSNFWGRHTYHLGLAPTIVSILNEIRLCKLVLSTAVAIISPPTKSQFVSGKYDLLTVPAGSTPHNGNKTNGRSAVTARWRTSVVQ